jgi:hypothetical protein
MQKHIVLLLFIASLSTSWAQETVDYGAFNKGNALLFKLSYGVHMPGGDLDNRFDTYFSLGSGVDFITTQSNWIFGLDYHFHFGNQVLEDVLSPLRNDQGGIIGNDRTIADIQLRMRGFYTGVRIGKLISLGFNNTRSGIRVTGGVGLFQHRIRIQDDPFIGVPQLSSEYKKGYDRLTNGLAFYETIGYQVLSRNKLINIYFGLELMQAFTQNRRDYDFDTMMVDETERLDLSTGFRLSWMLPLYFGKEADEIFY